MWIVKIGDAAYLSIPGPSAGWSSRQRHAFRFREASRARREAGRHAGLGAAVRVVRLVPRGSK